MPNTPRPPFSIYPLMAATGLSLIAIGTAGLLVRQLSWMHGLTFLAGVAATVALALTVGRPVLRKIAENQLGVSGTDPGPRRNDSGSGENAGFDFDPESFEETRTPREKEQERKRLGKERQRAGKQSKASTGQTRPSKSDQKLDDKIASLRALMEHPTTPEHERAAAAQALAKLLTKRSKQRGDL